MNNRLFFLKHLTNGFLFRIFEKTKSINGMNIIRKIDT